MELSVFIQKKTDDVSAKLFGVTKRTASSWRRMERAPSPMQSLKIIERSEGVVDWKGIYQPYVRYRSKELRKRE